MAIKGGPCWTTRGRTATKARLLANVAVTRARCKLFVVETGAMCVTATGAIRSSAGLLISSASRAMFSPSESIDDSFLADNFEKWAVALAEPAAFMAEMDGAIYSERASGPLLPPICFQRRKAS